MKLKVQTTAHGKSHGNEKLTNKIANAYNGIHQIKTKMNETNDAN